MGIIICRTACAIGALMLAGGGARAADYWVSASGSDSNSGTSQAQSFRTIGKAASAVSAGSKVHLLSGEYAENVRVSASGTQAAPIVFIAEPKWGAKLVPPSSSPNEDAFKAAGEWIVVDGLEIDGSAHKSGTRWVYGVALYGANTVAQNNKVHNISNADTACTHGAAGIVTTNYEGGSKQLVLRNVVYDIGPTTKCNLNHGIYLAAPDSRADNNIVWGSSAWGVTAYHDATRIGIANNTVFRNRSGGISVGSGGYYYLSASDVHDYHVINNIAFDNPGYGIANSETVGPGSYHKNNLVFGNGTNWSHNGSPSMPATGTVTADPQFVNYKPDGSGDYHLKSTSPAIGAGVAAEAPATDIEGLTRTPPPDIGAYKYGGHDTPIEPPTPPPGANCNEVIANWENGAIASQTGAFRLEYDTTPTGVIDGAVGLAASAVDAWSDMAAIVNFVPDGGGTVVVRNGGAYQALETYHYTTLHKYHVQMLVDVRTHKYDVYIQDVTATGAPEVKLAAGYAFRTEQAGVRTLSNVAMSTGIGTKQEVCAIAVCTAPSTVARGAPVSKGGDK